MRSRPTTRKPQRVTDAARKSGRAAQSHRGALLRAGLVALGAVALTAGSAAISSIRRRIETDS